MESDDGGGDDGGDGAGDGVGDGGGGGDDDDSEVPRLYQLLEIPATATPSEVKKAFFALARSTHPDKNTHEDAASVFAGIERAYHTLKDPVLRGEYDLRERVKAMLRRGFACVVHHAGGAAHRLVYALEEDGGAADKDPDVGTHLYHAPEEGADDLVAIEWKRIQQAAAAEDVLASLGKGPDGAGYAFKYAEYVRGLGLAAPDHVLCLWGKKMPEGAPLCLECDTQAARNALLDGLRLVRGERSNIFKERCADMKAAGLR